MSFDHSLQVVAVLGLGLAGFIIAQGTRNYFPKSGPSLPPGPKGLPIIKNLFDLPSKRQWLAVSEWAKRFGDIIHLNVLGQHIIFINNVRVVNDLLERRSSIYSDRIATSMMQLMDTSKILAFAPYGPDWRSGRRAFHQEFNSTTTWKHKDIQLKYCRALVNLLKDDPNAFEKHIQYFASAIILESVYGIEIKSNDDPLVKAAVGATEFLEGLVAGRFLVDAFPFLKYFPHWMPGADIIGTRPAKSASQGLEEAFESSFEQYSKAVEKGTALPSSMTSWLAGISGLPDGAERRRRVKAIRDVAATAFIAGFETTAATLFNFIYLLVENPEAQRKAQMELDQVVGRGRLPEFSDKEHLPYIMALYKEGVRWLPVAPLGVPHGTLVDDVYNGVRIPKGSLIIPNVWGFSRDEKQYGSDVEAFRPERFLNTNAMDPWTYVFGFGRRICPGRHMGENSVFIALAHLLHLFTFTRALDENGQEIVPKPSMINSLAVHLGPFPCYINPRFDGCEKLMDTYLF